jgi:biotin carboxyl carrier protein
LQHEIEVGGRLRRVAVSREGNNFAVSVDGRSYQVDAARVGSHSLSLIVDSRAASGLQEQASRQEPSDGSSPRLGRPGAVYDLTVVPDGFGRLNVTVGAVRTAVVLGGRRRTRRAGSGTIGSGPFRVVAPMPGKVVRVLVKPGDSVRARQPVVVVEAMKMENELRADRDGTVSEVHARDGTSVEAGTLLIVIQ